MVCTLVGSATVRFCSRLARPAASDSMEYQAPVLAEVLDGDVEAPQWVKAFYGVLGGVAGGVVVGFAFQAALRIESVWAWKAAGLASVLGLCASLAPRMVTTRKSAFLAGFAAGAWAAVTAMQVQVYQSLMADAEAERGWFNFRRQRSNKLRFTLKFKSRHPILCFLLAFAGLGAVTYTMAIAIASRAIASYVASSSLEVTSQPPSL